MDTPDQEWKPGESQDPEPSWGIPLPKDIRVTNLSLLSEPQQDQYSSGHDNPRRAVVLLYSPDIASGECDYLLFRLQVFRNNVSDSQSAEAYVARRPYYVMAYKMLQTSMKHIRWSGLVTSAFIAGACFQFDLRKSKGKKLTAGIENEDFIVTLGVVRTPGGMHALSVFKYGKTRVAPLSIFEVSKYQLSDLILTDDLSSTTDKISSVRFVWSIELLNGEVVCWSVPSIVASKLHQFDTLRADYSPTEDVYFRPRDIKRPKGLGRPFLVCEENSRNNNECWILGTLCVVGSVSGWALQSSPGCQFDIALGQVPQSMFGCVLRSGQNSQKVARSQIGDIDSHIFSSNILKMSTYSQSPFMITPPAFVISLYALLLEAASIRMDLLSEESPLLLHGQQNCLKVRNS